MLGIFLPPSSIICCSAGQFGGVQAAMQLRITLSGLAMPSNPSMLPVPRIQHAFTPAGEPTDPGFAKRHKRFLREFEWYADALRPGGQRRSALLTKLNCH